MARKGINIHASFDLEGFSKSSQNLVRKLKQTERKMKNIGASLTTYVTAPITALGGLSVKAAADIETLKTSLETALGDTAGSVDSVFKSVEKFASTTPFALQEVTTAFIKLKNMGLDPSMDALKSYGNTASAMGKSLDQMVEAVADAAVGEFERLKEFGIKAKQQGDQVSFTFKGVTTTVQKNSQEIEQYLQNIGNTEFAGGIEKQSQTLNGVLSTMKDNLSLAAASIGEIILPAVKRLAEFITNAAQRFREFNPETKKIIVTVAALAAAIGPLIYGLGALSAAMTVIVLHPVAATVVALTAGFVALKIAVSESNKVFDYVKKATDSMKQAYENLGTEIEKINRLKGNIVNASREEIQMTLASTRATIANTNALIKENLERKKKLLALKEEALAVAMQATRGVGRQGDFIDVEMSKVKVIQANINALTAEISELQKQGGLAVDSIIDLQKILKDLDESGKNEDAGFVDKIESKILGIKEAIGGLTTKGLEMSLPLKLDLDMSVIPEFIEKIDYGVSALGQRIMDLKQQIQSQLEQFAKDTAVFLGESLGNALTGNLSAETFGKKALEIVGGFMKTMGSLMIAYAVSMGTFAESIKNIFTWPVALAAGIAMVAAGQAISNLAGRGLEGGTASAPNVSAPSAPGFSGFDTQEEVLISTVTLSGRDMVLQTKREKAFRR